MSQLSSSISSNDNAEIKYKKALVQIQKISSANKLLKSQFDQAKAEYQSKLDKIQVSIQQILKSKLMLVNDKTKLEKLCSDLQASKTELKKEIAYLNNILSEQNTELRKVKAMKDDKTFSALILSYQNRQKEYRQDIQRQEQLLKSLKKSYETLEQQLTEERRLRFQFEDFSKNLNQQISQYRDLNLNLLNKNQSIVAMMVNRTNEGKDKYLETEIVLGQLSKQLQIIKNAKLQQESLSNLTVSRQSYESLLQEKSRMQAEVAQLRQKLEEQGQRSVQMIAIEQEVKRSTILAEQLSQQNNMLKNKITMLQTKKIMKEQHEEDSQLKQYQLHLENIENGDIQPAIKNYAQPSHFQTMKAYIMELKEKLSFNIKEKKEVQKKYYSIKEKIAEWTQKILTFEEQDKLLRGKLEGFQRLTQRLQFQLQKNMNIYEEEISKMKQATTIILNKRSEEIKAANSFFSSQLDQQRERLQKRQKKLQLEIDNLRQEINSEKIKYTELQDKYQQTNQFLNIYKNKFNAVNSQTKSVDKSNKTLSDSSFRYEQLYREERAKNESLAEIKTSLTSKINQLNNELRYKAELENEIELIRQNKQREIQQLREELIYSKQQIENFREKLRGVKRQIEDKNKIIKFSYLQGSGLQQNINNNFNYESEKNRQLQNEVRSLKLQLDRALLQIQRSQSLENSVNAKNDEINTLKKKIIALQKENTSLESQVREEEFESERVKRQNSLLKSSLLKHSQQLKKSSEFWEAELRKNLQNLKQQLAAANRQLNEEKKAVSKYEYEIQSHQSEIKMLQQFIEQNKKKELATFEELNQLRTSYQSLCEENERIKSELKFKNSLQENSNTQNDRFQQHIDKLNLQNSELRAKIQTGDNKLSELQHQLRGLKNYLPEVEDFANKKNPNESWQQQRDKENLRKLIQRIKEIVWENESSPKINVQYYSPHNPAPDKHQDYGKSNEENVVVNQWAPQFNIPPSNFLNIDTNLSKYFKNMDYY